MIDLALLATPYPLDDALVIKAPAAPIEEAVAMIAPVPLEEPVSMTKEDTTVVEEETLEESI